MIHNLGKELSRIRSNAGISQKELARRLREHGVKVTNQAVSKWETGTTQPNAVQFIVLCQILGVDDIIEEFTGEKGNLLTGLNKYGREKVKEYIELLKLSEKYREVDNVINIRQLPLYNIPASAGTGQFLDSDDYELVEVDENVPMNASFGVRLAGDSMQPKYSSGDIVWVTRSRILDSGDIGIFLYDGQVYCKKLDISANGARLISLNSEYLPIEIEGDRDFRTFGRVVGIWNINQ